MRFTCIICGKENDGDSPVHREMQFCAGCGSVPRFRGLILAVMLHVLKDVSRPLVDVAAHPDIKGIGVSDSSIYADVLAERFAYTNTFYHTEPHLDLCQQNSTAKYSNLDFIICSDVIEHTAAVPHLVLRNMLAMLRPGGVIILSAPTYYLADTIEHYPRAARLQVIERGNDYEVRWADANGIERVDASPCFHGGPGSTLEMREIAHEALLQDGRDEGFSVETLKFHEELGYWWPIDDAYPRPEGGLDGRIIVMKKPEIASRNVAFPKAIKKMLRRVA